MNNITTLLNGNKTYLSIAAVLLYVVGDKIGWWTADPEIVAAAFAVALGFLRMGVKSAQEAVAEPPIAPIK